MRIADQVRRGLGAATLLAGALVVYSTPAAAQNQSDTHWQAWLGCWQPTIAAPQDPVDEMYGPSDQRAVQEPILSVDTKAPHVCVLPAQGSSAVDIITVADDSIVSRHHVDASGAHAVVHDQGCDGWESAQWSVDNRRVYLHSELACSGGVTRKSDGLLAMAPNGDWLDVQSVNSGYGTGVKVMRYRDVGMSAPYPAELAPGLKQFAAERLAVGTARGVVGATVQPKDVEDASRIVTPQVVQAWLAARHQPFSLDARTLESLAKNGVPGSVTDVMVALSYPKQFALDANRRAVQYADENPYMSRADSARIAGAYLGLGEDMYDPFGWGYAGYGPYGYPGYGYASPYSPYGYGSPYYGAAYPYYGTGYGYGYGYGSGWYNSAPVVIVRDNPPQPHGRAVNGGGYTRGSQSGSSAGTAHPRENGSSSGASRSAGSSGSNDAGSSGSSSGRTAHKKPPV